MTRKPRTDDHMLESAIQEMEKHGPEALLGQLMLLSQEELAEFFVKLLKSYRLAARVANAAWRLKDLEPMEMSPLAAWGTRGLEVREALLKALEGYSPANFQPARNDYAKKLMELYEQAEHETSLAGVVELLYEEATKALKEAGNG